MTETQSTDAAEGHRQVRARIAAAAAAPGARRETSRWSRSARRSAKPPSKRDRGGPGGFRREPRPGGEVEMARAQGRASGNASPSDRPIADQQGQGRRRALRRHPHPRPAEARRGHRGGDRQGHTPPRALHPGQYGRGAAEGGHRTDAKPTTSSPCAATVSPCRSSDSCASRRSMKSRRCTSRSLRRSREQTVSPGSAWE